MRGLGKLAWPTLLGLGVVSALGAACPRSRTQAEQRRGAVVFLAADLRGYLAPCGCSEHMLGGVERAAAQIRAAREAGGAVFFADAGSSLLPPRTLSGEQFPQAERKARALAEAYTSVGIDAFAVGERDLGRGAPFVEGLGLPLLDAGQGTASAPAFRVVEHSGVRVGFVGLSGERPEAGLRAAEAARTAGAQVLFGLVQGSSAQASAMAETARRGGIALLVAGKPESELDGEKSRSAVAAVPVLSLMSKGRALARVDLSLVAGDGQPPVALPGEGERREEIQGLEERIAATKQKAGDTSLPEPTRAAMSRKIAELVQRKKTLEKELPAPPPGRSALRIAFVTLDDQLPSDPRVQTVRDRYDIDVAKLNLAWAKEHGRDCPPAPKGRAEYLGQNGRCESCHAEAFAVWRKTPHARAFQTLVDKNKQYDLECVRCHVVGYGLPGGVCRVDKVEGRENVGCESCHGPSSLHARGPSDENIVKPSEQSCRGCHTAENSPRFDFEAYLPRILGPGHGRPPATQKP